VDLGENTFDSFDAVFEAAFDAVGARRAESRLEIHFSGGEGLADFVVKFAGDLAAFGFLDLDKAMRDDVELMAGALAFEFTVLESLGHIIER
jgi:hypothetical protein